MLISNGEYLILQHKYINVLRLLAAGVMQLLSNYIYIYTQLYIESMFSFEREKNGRLWREMIGLLFLYI